MATKYVEDFYTTESMADDEAIQAAVDDLNDGDTLLFENGKTYVLNKPIYFTSYRSVENEDGTITRTGKNRYYLTIDGMGCKIAGSLEYLEQYGRKPEGAPTNYTNKNALFHTSDVIKNSMFYCTIRNFKFYWKNSSVTVSSNDKAKGEKYYVRYRSMAIGAITPDYTYMPFLNYAGNTCGVFDQVRFISASIPAAKPGEEDDHFVRLRYWRHGSVDKFILIE